MVFFLHRFNFSDIAVEVGPQEQKKKNFDQWPWPVCQAGEARI